MTTIHPTSKYGKLDISESNKVERFVEKPEFGGDWINGGFMVMEPEFLDWIDGDQTTLEQEPLLKATETSNLSAFKHAGFWHCMDTLRDRNELEELWQSQQAPWKTWNDK
jgi:glucose-1-phosphate cytidylyltransferase